MAVENKYVDANLEAEKKANALSIAAAQPFIGAVTFEVAAADTDASVYRLFKCVDPDLIPIRVEIYNDAITSGSDYDLGLYETLTDGQGGAEIDKNIFADALDMSSAAASGSPKDGLKDVNQADRVKRIYEHAGHTQTTKKIGYDICLTANTVGSAAGTITVIAFFVQG